MLDVHETAIALALGEIQSNYPEVAIGSYPRRKETGWIVIITLEGRDSEALAACTEAVSQAFSEHVLDAD